MTAIVPTGDNASEQPLSGFDLCKRRRRHAMHRGVVPGAGADVLADYSAYCFDCHRLPSPTDFIESGV